MAMAMGSGVIKESGRSLIEILLETRKNLANLHRPAEIDNSVGNRGPTTKSRQWVKFIPSISCAPVDTFPCRMKPRVHCHRFSGPTGCQKRVTNPTGGEHCFDIAKPGGQTAVAQLIHLDHHGKSCRSADAD